MGSINERILFLIEDLGYNKNSFAKKIGFTSGAMIQNIVGKRKSKPGSDILAMIIQSFPEINSHWLLTGMGKIYKINPEEIDVSTFRKNFNELCDEKHFWNPEADKQVEELKKENEILKEKNGILAKHLKDTEKTISTMQKLIDVLEKK